MHEQLPSAGSPTPKQCRSPPRPIHSFWRFSAWPLLSALLYAGSATQRAAFLPSPYPFSLHTCAAARALLSPGRKWEKWLWSPLLALSLHRDQPPHVCTVSQLLHLTPSTSPRTSMQAAHCARFALPSHTDTFGVSLYPWIFLRSDDEWRRLQARQWEQETLLQSSLQKGSRSDEGHWGSNVRQTTRQAAFHDKKVCGFKYLSSTDVSSSPPSSMEMTQVVSRTGIACRGLHRPSREMGPCTNLPARLRAQKQGRQQDRCSDIHVKLTHTKHFCMQKRASGLTASLFPSISF